jgi:hypothetical protein
MGYYRRGAPGAERGRREEKEGEEKTIKYTYKVLQ